MPLRTIACLLLALLAAGSASAASYRLDPVHTRVVFLVDHAGLSRAIGAFSGVQGRLEFDPEHWAQARVDLTVPVTSLELGDADWRDKVLADTFLDAGDHPTARFVSTSVEPTGEGSARIAGTLTLRGITRPVVLDVRLNAVKRHPITRRRSAGFSATATLSRRDFGIVDWPNVIGDRVELLIEAEALLDRGAHPSHAPGTTDATSDPQSR